MLERLSQGERWDLIVSDLMMPGMDGGKFVKTLAEDPAMADVRVLILSAVDPERMAELMAVPNVVGTLQKPADPMALAAKVSDLLDR